MEAAYLARVKAMAEGFSAGPLRGPDNLSTPRRALSFFFRAANAQRWDEAAEFLDVSQVPFLNREAEGRRKAMQLLAILNRVEILPPALYPDEPLGPPAFLYRSPGNAAEVIEVDLNGEGSWKVSPGSLERFEDIWVDVRDRPILGGRMGISEEQFDPSSGIRRSLPSSYRTSVLGLQGWQWIVLGCISLASTLMGWLAWLALRKIVRHIDRAENPVIGLERRRRVARGGAFVLGATVFRSIFPLAALPPAAAGALELVLTLVVVAASFLFAWAVWSAFCDWLGGRLVNRSATGQKLFLPIIQQFGQALIIIGLLLYSLSRFGFNVGGLVAGLGLGGIILGFAAKDTIENVFGSITIMLERSFGIGDWVKVGAVEGTVEDITLRSIRIRTFADSLVVLPNNRIITEAVENMGKRRHRRLRVLLHVEPSATLAQVQGYLESLRESVSARSEVQADPFSVNLHDMSPSGPVLLLLCFLDVPDVAAENQCREEILGTALRLAEEHGLTLGAR
jgi:MscS family membrane protein